MTDSNSYQHRMEDLIRKAVEDDEAGTPLEFYKDLDYVQLTPDYMREACKRARKDHRRKGLKRLGSVAAAAAIILTVSSVIAVFITSNPVDAVKNKIERQIIRIQNSLIVKKDNPAQVEDTGEVVKEIEKWEDVEKAKKFLEELYIPQYVPDGYEFKLLTVEKELEVGYRVYYDYLKEGKKELLINIHSLNESMDEDLIVTNGKELIEISDGTIYITSDEFGDMTVGTMMQDHVRIRVSGEITREELEKIFEGLKQ